MPKTVIFLVIAVCIHFQLSAQVQSIRKGSGTPVVIFVSGMGEDHSTWSLVQDSISKTTTTISYDRAGLGTSKFNGEKKDLTSMAGELNELLNNEKIIGAVILVGHSLGCQIIREFSSLHPTKVRSMVLIDPGYNPLHLKHVISDSVWNLRERKLKQYIPKLSIAQQAEFDLLIRNMEDAEAITNLPNVPVVLLTATLVTNFPASQEEVKVKTEAHAKWLKMMPSAKHFEVSDSRHYVHIDKPGLIVHKVLDMVRL